MTAPKIQQICFIDMPFGTKIDSKSRVRIDFDAIYEKAIFPAIKSTGLECIRGDQERTGGIIHSAMFARLLLAEFVIADLTTANPNVFYELGIRHTAKPFTTIPIFATLGDLCFDVNFVRAIPYELENGALTDAAAENLRNAIIDRVRYALEGPVSKDSPLFQLFDNFPGITMSHQLTDVFRDRVKYSDSIKQELSSARQLEPREQALAKLKEIETSLGDLKVVERGVLIDFLLSYRAIEAFDEMITLPEKMPSEISEAAITQQQLAFALNRRNNPGDQNRAVNILNNVLENYGESAETLGLLGRVYKDQYQQAKQNDDLAASAYLDLAIQTYIRGFEVEPGDYYPGVNAITLLLQKGDQQAEKELNRLAPLVTYAAIRQGGEDAKDYWTVATLLELSLVNRDYQMAQQLLPKCLILADETWMYETTANNLKLIYQLRRDEPEAEQLQRAIDALINKVNH